MQIPADVVKEFIIRRMARRDPPWRVAALAQANFHIEIDSAQVLACWRDRNAPPTHTGPIQNKEPMQIPTDQVTESLGKHMACDAPPLPVVASVPAHFGIEIDRAQAVACTSDRSTLPTHTGPIQDEESMAVLTDEIKVFIVKALARFDTRSPVAGHAVPQLCLPPEACRVPGAVWTSA